MTDPRTDDEFETLGWEEVYNTPAPTYFNRRYKHLVYYQTSGGGPEGGYAVNPKNGWVYRVSRSWFQPYRCSLQSKLLRLETAVSESGILYCHIIETLQ